MRNNITKIIIMACLFASCIGMTACGKTYDTTGVAVNKEGKVTSVICADFTAPNYDVNELTDMATAEISEYNSEYLSSKITMDPIKYKEDDNSVKMIMTYNSAYDYAAFNHVSFFYGTVNEAIDKGYTIAGSMVSADGEKLPEDWKEQFGEKHVIICDEKTEVRTPYKIEYATEGVKLLGKKEADLSNIDGVVQLLLSK